MTLIFSPEQIKSKIIRDLAKKRLEKIFSNPKHSIILEQMTRGHIFDTWVEMTSKELSELVKLGASKKKLANYVINQTTQYAELYLNTMAAMAAENK